ncbi:MAG: hypothetical protein R2724_26980 [Bryobacterales bacterium]
MSIRVLWMGLALEMALYAAPTFTKDVAPILFENCVSCHREGEAAPFSLLTYEDAKKRGALIAAVTEARYMPPWHAAEGAAPFRDERRLNEAQIATLSQWVKAGMPQGAARDLPKAPQFADGWQLGEPDLVVEFSDTFEIPADGPDLYRSFAIPLNLGEQKWVRAVEFRPQARGSSHHALFFWDGTGSAVKADVEDPDPGFGGMAGALRRTAGAARTLGRRRAQGRRLGRLGGWRLAAALARRPGAPVTRGCGFGGPDALPPLREGGTREGQDWPLLCGPRAG